MNSMTRATRAAFVIGVVLGCSLISGLQRIGDGMDEVSHAENDRRADSLAKRIIETERENRVLALEQRRLSSVADSVTAVARASLASARPRTFTVATASARLPVADDTVAVVAVVRSGVPYRVPQFVTDEIAALDARFATVKQAWQIELAARLHQDSIRIPALERQLAEAYEALAIERDRVQDRDQTIAKKDRELARRRRFGFSTGLLTGSVGTVLVLAMLL